MAMKLSTLSNEQMRCVNHGLSRTPDAWEPIELLTGVHPLPAWLKSSIIRWDGYYSNSPSLCLRTWAYNDPRVESEGHRMPNWYRQERPGHWVDRHIDGRVKHYFSRQPIVWMPLRRFVGCDERHRPQYEEYEGWATAEHEAGFGGDIYTIRERVDGPGDHIQWDSAQGHYRTVELRGPWHGSPPPDCVECGSDLGALCITIDLFMRIYARFHSWHKLALVTRSDICTVDPVHMDWPAPKQFLPDDHPVWNTTEETNPWWKPST